MSASRARSITCCNVCWCPLWTPSKTPIVTTDRPHPGGSASKPRQRCTVSACHAARSADETDKRLRRAILPRFDERDDGSVRSEDARWSEDAGQWHLLTL